MSGMLNGGSERGRRERERELRVIFALLQGLRVCGIKFRSFLLLFFITLNSRYVCASSPT